MIHASDILLKLLHTDVVTMYGEDNTYHKDKNSWFFLFSENVESSQKLDIKVQYTGPCEKIRM